MPPVRWTVVALVLAAQAFALWRRSRFVGTAAQWIEGFSLDPYLLVYAVVPIGLYASLKRAHSRVTPETLLRYGSWRRVVVAGLVSAATTTAATFALLISLAILASIGLPWDQADVWWALAVRVLAATLQVAVVFATAQTSALLPAATMRLGVAVGLYLVMVWNFKRMSSQGPLSPVVGLVLDPFPRLVPIVGCVCLQVMLFSWLSLRVAAWKDRQVAPQLLSWVMLAPAVLLALGSARSDPSALTAFGLLWQGTGHDVGVPSHLFAITLLTHSGLFAWLVILDRRCDRGLEPELLRSGSVGQWIVGLLRQGGWWALGGYAAALAITGLVIATTAESWGVWPAELGTPIAAALRLVVLGPLGVVSLLMVTIGVRVLTGSSAAVALVIAVLVVLAYLRGWGFFPIAHNSLLRAAGGLSSFWYDLAALLMSICAGGAVLRIVAVRPLGDQLVRGSGT